MANTAHVLVVEDDVDIAESIRMILEGGGYEVTLAANGLEGLDCCADRRPDVIVLDMMMPVLDGWGFARELASREPDNRPPIIVVTAAEHARSRAEEIGADAFIRKPFEGKMLLATIAQVLARPLVANESRS